MKIETKRLLLRPFTAADGEDLYSYLSDPEVVRFEPYDVFTKADAEKEAARRAGDPNFFAVVLKKTGHVIGNLYFAPSEYEKYEFGYVLSRAYWKNGYATEAADALLRDAFAQKKLHRVEAYCHPDNVNSWHLLERLGFKREAHLRRDIWFRKDEAGAPIWQDTYIYGLLEEDLGKEAHEPAVQNGGLFLWSFYIACVLHVVYLSSIQTTENAEDVQGAIELLNRKSD